MSTIEKTPDSWDAGFETAQIFPSTPESFDPQQRLFAAACEAAQCGVSGIPVGDSLFTNPDFIDGFRTGLKHTTAAVEGASNV